MAGIWNSFFGNTNVYSEYGYFDLQRYSLLIEEMSAFAPDMSNVLAYAEEHKEWLIGGVTTCA